MNTENGEVICISSDEDEETEQNKNIINSETEIEQSNNNCISTVKVEILAGEDETVKICGQKRKVSDASSDSDIDHKRSTKVTLYETGDKAEAHGTEKNFVEKEKEKKLVLKPKLIVKEKKTISQVGQDIFPMFISLCLQKDRSEDMKVIVNKLKRRYEQLDPVYANSEAFINFLNEKRNNIMSSKKKLFIHIAEVMNEMKNSCKGKSTLSLNGKNCSTKKSNVNNNLNIPSVSHSNILSVTNEVNGSGSEEGSARYDTTQRKIRILLKAMKKCEKCIKKLEDSEINFDDDNNSSYIKLERYKHRMIELYNKYCEYTGENTDAGRPYLRPKHFSTTGIVNVDQAITSFINSKISKRHQLKKVGAFTDSLIFPDYRDILECVTKCNELHNLGLDTKKQQQIAKKAFVDLGEHLQRVRRNDYWDTFSLFLEDKEDDPAVKDPELAEKLLHNRTEGEKRLANVFKTYVEKQEEMKDRTVVTNTSSENEEDENEDNDEEDDDVSEGNASFSISKTSADEDGDSTDGSESFKTKSECDIIKVDGKCSKDTTHKVISNSINSVNTDGVVTTNCNDNSKSESVNTNGLTTSCDRIPTTTVEKISTNVTEEDKSNVNEESVDSKPLEEGKPLLRVRSFAKPPTTWKDIQHRVDETSTNKGIQKTTGTGIVDLTVETQKENTVTKCATIQIGSKVLPTVKGKYKTLVIPTGKSIIKVKNITNNYVRLNAQDLGTSKVIKLQSDPVRTSSHQIVSTNDESTLVHHPSNVFVNQQMNVNSQAKNLQAKQKSTILRINQPNKMIFLSTKIKENALQPSRANSSESKFK